jgi:MFS-type transporter involved in bile tolerance (Atg22 family)
MGFSVVMVAIFIAVIGILSVCAQLILGFLMRVLGSKKTIMVGLFLEMLQLLWYGLGSQTWYVSVVSHQMMEANQVFLKDDVGSWTPGLHFQHHVPSNQRFRLHAHRC